MIGLLFSLPILHTATLPLSNGGQPKQIAWPYLILIPSFSLTRWRGKKQGVVVRKGAEILMPYSTTIVLFLVVHNLKKTTTQIIIVLFCFCCFFTSFSLLSVSLLWPRHWLPTGEARICNFANNLLHAQKKPLYNKYKNHNMGTLTLSLAQLSVYLCVNTLV